MAKKSNTRYAVQDLPPIILKSMYPTEEELSKVREEYEQEGIDCIVWGSWGAINIFTP